MRRSPFAAIALLSHPIRHARGDDGHNVVTVVMNQFGLDVQSSIHWTSRLHDELAEQFKEQWQKIPTFGDPIDQEVSIYCHGLANWVRANECWSFEVSWYCFFVVRLM